MGVADEVLAARRQFGLNAEQREVLQVALDAPPKTLPLVKKLMQEQGGVD